MINAFGTKAFPEPRPAPRAVLIRRLYFDLLGLPPTPAETQAFQNDRSPRAYEHLVDALLARPAFGERMAAHWMDLVRYADTAGYHSDNHQEISAYRDYVIDAFNKNIPFDQFTVEQLAGDLLPRPNLNQRIASGYNRLLQTTAEGGAQEKEYIAIYAADRVRNVSSVWMGATLGCAQCHDHKFDPYTARDFYSMAAFFADIQEPVIAVKSPNLDLPTKDEAAELGRLDAAIQGAGPLDYDVPQGEGVFSLIRAVDDLDLEGALTAAVNCAESDAGPRPDSPRRGLLQ